MKKLPIALLVCLLNFAIKAQENDFEKYPEPPQNENMLFYLQRNINKNTIIYELNRFPEGTINTNKPVIIYWIRYEEGGKRKELSSIQQMAFGLNFKYADNDTSIFVLHFKKHASRKIYLIKDENSSFYKAYIYINGERSCLQRIFIQFKSNVFRFMPEIKHIDIFGISLKSNRLISERYQP